MNGPTRRRKERVKHYFFVANLRNFCAEAALEVARFRKAPTSPSQPAVPPQDRKRSASPEPVRSQRSKRG